MNENDVEALLETTALVPAPSSRRAPPAVRPWQGRLMTAAALLVCAAVLAALFVAPSRVAPTAPSQDELQKTLDAILKRLGDESIEARDAAMKELRGFLDGDAKAELVQGRLSKLGADARARVEEELERFVSRRHGRIAYQSGLELRVVDWNGRNPGRLAADRNPPIGVEWAPDFSRAAYTSGNCIEVVGPDGERLKRINCGSREPHGVSWSPDGKRLTYWTWSTGDAGCRKVWVGEVDGEQKQLTDEQSLETHPRWSPDGTWIAFWNDEGSLLLMHPDGRERHALATLNTKGVEPTCLWTRDGKALLAAGAEDARIVQLDGRERGRLEGWGWNWQWSPDGTRLVFERENNIWVVDGDLKTAKALTAEARENRSPAWSLDGRMIAFLSGRDDPRERGVKGFSPRLELYVMEAGGANPVRLTTEGVQSRPSWMRDER